MLSVMQINPLKKKLRDNRDYTYSDLGKLIEKIRKEITIFSFFPYFSKIWP